MAGTQSTQTSTSNSSPWSAQQPYLQQGFDAAQKIYQGPGVSYFPNSTVAPTTANQNSAFNMGSNIAQQGQSNISGAQNFNNDVINGKYQNNPYSDQVFNNIQSHVAPAVNSQFSAAGRYGSDSHANALATGLTNAYAPYASQNYQQGIGNMQQAAGMAPSLNAGQWNNAQNLQGLGAQQQQHGQLQTNDAVARYNYNSNLPQLRLNQFQQNVGGNWGGVTTNTQPLYTPSIFSQIAGGGLGLAGLLG